MSLYNMICGTNPFTTPVLIALGLERIPKEAYRFRDVYINEEGEIGIVARIGGRNCRDYSQIYDLFRTHPCFIGDEDSEFDNTFATFYFSVPAYFEAMACGIASIQGVMHPLDRFRQAVDDMRDGVDTEQTQRMLEVGEKLISQIMSGETGKIETEEGGIVLQSLTKEQAIEKIRDGWRPIVVDTDDVDVLSDMGYDIEVQED